MKQDCFRINDKAPRSTDYRPEAEPTAMLMLNMLINAQKDAHR